MREFISFRKLIAPVLIKIIYWVLTAVSVIFGLILIVMSTQYYNQSELVPGLLLLVLGPVVVRLWAEVMLTVFRAAANIADLRDVAVRDAYERDEAKRGISTQG